MSNDDRGEGGQKQGAAKRPELLGLPLHFLSRRE